MPVLKCKNGKWRIGTGACVYETKEKAEKAYKAILAQGKFKKKKNGSSAWIRTKNRRLEIYCDIPFTTEPIFTNIQKKLKHQSFLIIYL